MANTARRVAAAIVVAMTLMTLMTARPATAGEETLTLVLRVENHAGISSEILRRAEEQATRTYAAIGVRLIWVHDDTEDPGLRTRHLTVLLLSREMTERKIAADGVADHELGRAAAATRRAYIFSDRIATIAAKTTNSASVLGPVLAHEVGHMVLPVHSHSTTGIMRANLDACFGLFECTFTEAQSVLIRRVLMASGANETGTADAADAAARAR